MELDTLESNLLKSQLGDLMLRFKAIKKKLDFSAKLEKLAQLEAELQEPDIWKNVVRTKSLSEEKSQIIEVVEPLQKIPDLIEQAELFLEMAIDEADETAILSIKTDIEEVENLVKNLEFKRMFSGKMDSHNAYIDIQAGSGGTEAQDWAEMLFRMYLRFFARKCFKSEIIEISQGDVAGIKSASIYVRGSYVYGWLKTELGVHRLVRKSPFDSSHKRHTSFASVFVSPEVDDNIKIEINPADLRIDTYRASGAGGQHVNKTESAVRITHLPTNTVVQCQSGRSQHMNKDTAMKKLRADLYELEMQKKRAVQDELEKTKSDVGWGSQIRSYVLDQSRIKDLRTGFESSNPTAVLDGDLEPFIEVSLKEGLGV